MSCECKNDSLFLWLILNLHVFSCFTLLLVQLPWCPSNVWHWPRCPFKLTEIALVPFQTKGNLVFALQKLPCPSWTLIRGLGCVVFKWKSPMHTYLLPGGADFESKLAFILFLRCFLVGCLLCDRLGSFTLARLRLVGGTAGWIGTLK